MEHGSSRILERVRAAAERAERARREEPRQGAGGVVCFDPGECCDGTMDQSVELLPQRIGHYEVIGELARGGAGVVYRGWDGRLQRHAAVKVMLSGTWDKPSRVSRFLREARAAARLDDPGVVRIFDVGATAEGAVWFAMELVEGPSLADVLADRGALPPEEALALLDKVAATLERVHEAGLVHRDIKPSNILISRAGEPLLTDFGLVLDVDHSEPSGDEDPAGTPAYMAPEQARADRGGVDWYRADVYALGALLYNLLSGRQPPAFWHLADRPLPPVAGLPRDLMAICRRAMSYDPSRRYASVRALRGELARFAGGLPVLAGDSSLSWRAWLAIKRHGHTLQTLAIAAIAAAATWLLLGGAWPP